VKTLIDTNVLLDDISVLEQYSTAVICLPVLEELDRLKISHDNDVAYKAREAIRKLKESQVEFDIDEVDLEKTDNRILDYALRHGYRLLTNDLNLQLKAKAIGVEVENYIPQIENYTGYKEVTFSNEELASWYEGNKNNNWGLINNQYLIVKYEDTYVGVWKYINGEFKEVFDKCIDSKMLGKIKPLDPFQRCAIDSLYTNQVTVLKGKAGSGKSLLSLAYAISEIERGNYERLIIFTNPVPVLNSAKLGFYPGDKNEKLLSSNIGNMLISKFGDKVAVEMLINQNKLVLLPFSDIRGFDTSGMRAIVYITEAQNLNINLMKIAAQRIGVECKFIIDGDNEAQVDLEAFSGKRNGMRRLSEVFRGQNFYGEVELKNIHRSKIAELADKM
jgi:predicted ribonuclease YlaK